MLATTMGAVMDPRESVSCTLPHKKQKSDQNDHQTVRFCNGIGRHPNLGFLERPSRLNPSAFKSTFSSLRSRVSLNQPFRGPRKHSPPVRGGVHDPPPCGTCLYRRLTFGLASHQASLGQTVRDSKGLEFKPNGVIPPVGLGPVRAQILVSLSLIHI